MTYLEKIKECVSSASMEQDGMEKLIALAYWYGRESATKEVSDLYKGHIAEQHKRASATRYRNLAMQIVGEETYLYSPDYAGDMTSLFGSDEWK